jgi:hypothetical protein
LKTVNDDVVALAEALEVIQSLGDRLAPKTGPSVQSIANAMTANTEPKPPRKERARLKPKDFTKPKREPAITQEQAPFGTFGCWDHKNEDWERPPTVADIPEIMRQKQQRYPGNNLWASEENMLEWFTKKGWRTSCAIDTD